MSDIWLELFLAIGFSLAPGFIYYCFTEDQDLILVGFYFVFSVVNSVLISLLAGCVVGFCVFMTMISGVLVLVSYCMALSPFIKEKGDALSELSEKSLKEKWLSGSHYWSKVTSKLSPSLVWGLNFLVMLMLVHYFMDVSYFHCEINSFLEGVSYPVSWPLFCVLMSSYLLCCAVAVIDVCSRFSGALVSGKWKSKAGVGK